MALGHVLLYSTPYRLHLGHPSAKERHSMNYTDQQIRDWAYATQQFLSGAGGFVKAFGRALLAADDSNFELLRPVAVQIIAKYPKYLEMAKELI